MQSFFRKTLFTPGLPQMKIAFFFVEKLIITQRLYYTRYYTKHGRNYFISVHFRGNLAINLSRRNLSSFLPLLVVERKNIQEA